MEYFLKDLYKASERENKQRCRRSCMVRPTRKETASVVNLLESALYRRRLVQYGGVLKQIKRELKIKDAEENETDLINLTGRKTSCKYSICNGEMSEVLYLWNNILANYYED